LAGVFEWGGRPSILCWDTATRKLLSNQTIDDKYGLRRFRNDLGRAIEWLPDRSAWLVYGQALIDRQTGHWLWALPVYYPDFPPTARRLIEGDRAVLTWAQGRNLVVRTAALPREELARARQIVSSGGSAVDAVLPPVRHPDLSSLHTVPAAATAWSVTADPAPAPAKALLTRPIVLKNFLDEIRGVFCSTGDAPQAVVSIQSGEPNAVGGNAISPALTHAIERYDLTNGKRLGRNDVPPVCELVAFSPEGGRIILRDMENRDRLDVYSTVDMKYLAGWRPYEKETGYDRIVIWTAFLDQHRALTINPAGKLVLWTLPDCRAYYVVKDACQGIPVLSPGRKMLAGFAGGSIRFIEAATGKRLGEAATPTSDESGRAGLRAAAFRPDGLQLAALLNGGQIARIDLTSGKAVSEFRSPIPQAGFLEWCGNRHVLVNNQSLVDVDRQMEVWRYVAGVPSQVSPDGRHWAAVEPYASQPAYLAGFAIPDKTIDKVVNLVLDKKTTVLLRSGVPLTLKVEISGAPKRMEPFRNALYEYLSGQLRANDVPTAEGQPVTLLARIDEIDTGDKPELKDLIPGMKDDDQGKKKVPIKVLKCELALVDSAGKVSLDPEQIYTFRELGTAAMAAATEKKPGEFLEDRLWDLVKNRLMSEVIPPYVARDPAGGFVRFPGFSNLGQLVKK
jgi:hypothetical protein